jgi:16S rRNA (guanine(966)-N(2))-methyltransferase RsmD
MSGLRVIAGSARGRRLRSVPGISTRPITDRTKESLFNIIGADIVNSTFLDLFGGTGSVGIEALSRGAARALFFDLDQRAIATIRKNLEITGFGSRGEVKRGDVFKILTGRPQEKFDYIYIAPPQFHGLWSKAIELVDEHPAWMADDAWVIVQIYPKEHAELNLANLKQFDARRYGNTLLVFYTHEV